MAEYEQAREGVFQAIMEAEAISDGVFDGLTDEQQAEIDALECARVAMLTGLALGYPAVDPHDNYIDYEILPVPKSDTLDLFMTVEELEASFAEDDLAFAGLKAAKLNTEG